MSEKNIYTTKTINVNDLRNRIKFEKKKEKAQMLLIVFVTLSVLIVFGITVLL